MKTLQEQVACLARELAVRRNVYRKWVSSGKMKHETATHEIECMEAALETVEKVRDLAETSEEIKKQAPSFGYPRFHPQE